MDNTRINMRYPYEHRKFRTLREDARIQYLGKQEACFTEAY